MSSMKQAQAQQEQASYQADVARNNQVIAQQNAKAALDAGETEAQTQRIKTAALVGQQRSAAAGSGLDPNVGSAADLQGDAAFLGEQDVNTIKHNATLQAYGYQVQGTTAAAQAGLYEAQAKAAGGNGLLSAGGSLAGGASTVSDKWLKYWG